MQAPKTTVPVDTEDDDVVFLKEVKAITVIESNTSSSSTKTKAKPQSPIANDGVFAIIVCGIPREDFTNEEIERGINDTFIDFPLLEVIFNGQKKYRAKCRVVFSRILKDYERAKLFDPKSTFNKHCRIKNSSGQQKDCELRLERIQNAKMLQECREVMTRHRRLLDDQNKKAEVERQKEFHKYLQEKRKENNRKRRAERHAEEQERLKRIRLEKQEKAELQKEKNKSLRITFRENRSILNPHLAMNRR
ncbi:hypothetical protein QR680_014060 [Steinernema hermaphroditum]|uniref:Uncharacterized protein n=1 Tax=Steinernema hermaphroditum TaxID=289476 RepID=A0AA39LZZ6_9BILA|nr:hypothetical protein QR680_016159 [Steinernema hermaphroditum]KAK0415565.1 hypothetical protein QR680_012003 [Steinernema hermaphroditum]KAK0419282.1 hypothetical protein QR680_014060 [Steinernema hermaphroditum]